MNETRDQTEEAIIGCILNYPNEATKIAIEKGVRSKWFAVDGYAAIFEAAHRAFTAGTLEKLDALALCNEARLLDEKTWKRGRGFLAEANWVSVVEQTEGNGAMVAHIYYHINVLRRHVFKTDFSKAVKKAMDTFDADPQQAIAMVTNCAAKVYGEVMGETSVSKSEICAQLENDEYMSWHMRVDDENPDRDKDWVPGLKAPWQALTRMYLGIGKRLHIIAARPSVGKTSFAVNLARYWADSGVKLFVNSLDMPPEDIIDRLRTEKSRVSITKKRYTPTKENLERLKEASVWICNSTIDVTEHYYVEDYCADLALKAKSGKVEAAIVDYVQLLNSYAVDNANEYQRVSYVAEYLKRTANQFKIPIVALCQLNRKGVKDEGAEPGLADLRGSGALEQAASTVLVLHRDQAVVDGWKKEPAYWLYKNEQYGRQNAAQAFDAVWAILLKNQNGPTGRLPFVVHKPYFAWKLADVNALPSEREEGFGATKRVVRDYRQSFGRIHRDWRRDSWEADLEGKIYPFPVDGHAVNILIEEGQ